MPLKIDNEHGAGAVPHNRSVDYYGLRVRMRPSVFLALTSPLAVSPAAEKRIEGLVEFLRGGGAVGAPFLDIDIPDAWEDEDFSEIPRVSGHEGRHRMIAARRLYGDEPVEVHLFPRHFRARHITPRWARLWNTALVRERTNDEAVRGPLFAVA